jgi:predicted nucleic acid-binding protein
MYLIDTNILSELPKRNADPRVVSWFGSQTSIVLSVITLEELIYGVERTRPEQAGRLRSWLERLLAIPPRVIPVDEEIARAAGLLRASRERAGRIMTQADALIAATAAATGRILVTRNVKDFDGCGVPLLNPFSA